MRSPGVHVNLIPVNPVDETGFRAPDAKRVNRFREVLGLCGVNATVRREMGRDINGACGQLRRGYEERKEAPAGPAGETAVRRRLTEEVF